MSETHRNELKLNFATIPNVQKATVAGIRRSVVMTSVTMMSLGNCHRNQCKRGHFNGCVVQHFVHIYQLCNMGKI